MIPDVQKHFFHLKTRARILQAIRDYFCGQDYLEIDTPIRCPSIIPEAHIDPVTSDGQFLQASPELCMKRMLARGFDRIFQICKCFRQNERGQRHIPELTLLEWYTKDHTYLDLMRQCHELINFIADQLKIGPDFHYQNQHIDFLAPWSKLTVKQAFEHHADVSVKHALQHDLFDEVISYQIEPALKNTATPVFLYNYPASQASLSQRLPDTPEYAQRFELYICGIEIANGFTELTDPIEQQQRFNKENQIRKSMGKNTFPLPEKFLSDLTTVPDSAGIALGVDRLAMIFCNTLQIDDVIAFTPEDL